ncbi:MAG TPA: cytidylate kinase family protein [Candidatus Norongarragalinales archaeon]|nr:cytidylate kinase family protein [Candidatus Norongarragalinales archaeon]
MKIAVSGLSGSGNSTVCKIVGKKLGIPVINYTLRDMAQDLGMGFSEISRKRKEDPAYDLMLDKMQLEQFDAKGNAILGSRLAIWLAGANLYVWLDAGLRERARRIATREGTSLKAALAATRKRDLENARQYRKIYGIDVGRHEFADIAIDTERNSAAQVAAIIIRENAKARYNKPRKGKYGGAVAEMIRKGLLKTRC